MGEIQDGPVQLPFTASLKIDFQGSRVTSETELMTQEGSPAGPASINRELIAEAETLGCPQRVVLDMDSKDTSSPPAITSCCCSRYGGLRHCSCRPDRPRQGSKPGEGRGGGGAVFAEQPEPPSSSSSPLVEQAPEEAP